MKPEQANSWMDRALTLAARGRGTTRPNPMVGSVVIRDGRVVGEGFHARAGQPHAEVHALVDAGDSARDSDLVVTLEPCCHVGRTPACTDAIIEAGVARVWVGTEDPNPRVAGKGIAALQAAGIEVHVGVRETRCRELNRGYNHWMKTRRPHVVLKLATSLDGKIATGNGASQWITGPEAREAVHLLRAEADAVMVGSGTAIADDPALSVRLVPYAGDPPTRLVLDSKLRIQEDAKVFAADGAEVIVATSSEANPTKIQTLRDHGATVLTFPTPEGHVALSALLGHLATLEPRPVRSLLVEGGSGLATALVQADLVDEIRLFMAPMWIGDDGLGALGALGLSHPDAAPRFVVDAVERHATDIEIRLSRREDGACSQA